MPKYCVKNYFTHGRFPEGGQKQKTDVYIRKQGTKAKMAVFGGYQDFSLKIYQL